MGSFLEEIPTATLPMHIFARAERTITWRTCIGFLTGDHSKGTRWKVAMRVKISQRQGPQVGKYKRKKK
jgi:hypothetical protein